MEREIFKMQGHEDVAEHNYVFTDEWVEHEGGSMLRINEITSYRDGGTIAIETNKGTFFGDKALGTIHIAYPPRDDNKIEDDFLRRYLINLVGREVFRLKEEARWKGSIFEKLNKA